jgi:glycerophosphoryl diester phosphodiesterase
MTLLFATHRLLQLAAFLGLCHTAFAFDFFEPVTPPRKFQTMVHRGMSSQAPENTRPAIELASEDGIEWAEVDVRLTSDEKHVLFHDEKLDGKSNGSGLVKYQTLAELKALDLGSWFAKRYEGERILTLAECLNAAKGHINLYLDCKDIDPELLVREVLAAGMEKQCVVFDDMKTLERVQALSEGKVAVMPKWDPSMPMFDKQGLQPAAIEIDADEVTPEICKSFHKAGIKVQAKVLNEWDKPEWWDKCLDAGVDWYQTDLPEELISHAVWKSGTKHRVQFSLHRGANHYAPENTLPAFEKAIRLGADFVEFDVRTTSDGKFYLLHDGSLDRTTNGQGAIRHHSSSEVAAMDAGSWFGKPFVGVKIPTLDQFLSVVKGKINLYFDAKDITPAELAKAVDKAGMAERTIVYQGPGYLLELKKIDPRIRAMPPLDGIEDVARFAADLKPYCVDAAWSALSKELIDSCHTNNIKVFSDALGRHENIEDYLAAIDWGIDLIQTDHPLRVIRAMELLEIKAKP